MMLREKHAIGKSMSHSTRIIIPSLRALQIMTIEAWTMALSWRQWSMLSRPNQRRMEKILMQPCPIWVMTKDQQMQIHKLHEQEDIKPVIKQNSADAWNAALETKLRICSQPKEGDVKEKEGETPKEPAWRRNRRNPVLTCQASAANCKKIGCLLGSPKRKVNASCVYNDKRQPAPM